MPVVGSEAQEAGGTVIVLVSKVAAPFRARARPMRVAPVFMVMLCSAITVPWKLVVVPKVAELVTCQKTPQAWALLVRRTLDPLAVVSVLPIWKT